MSSLALGTVCTLWVAQGNARMEVQVTLSSTLSEGASIA